MILTDNNERAITSLPLPRTNQSWWFQGQNRDGFGCTPLRWTRKELSAGRRGPWGAHHGRSRPSGCERGSPTPHYRSSYLGRSCWQPLRSDRSGCGDPSDS